MKDKKIGIVSCSLFLAAGALIVGAILPTPDYSFNNGFSVKATGNEYSLTLNSSNKYIKDGENEVLTDSKGGGKVKFSYTDVSASSNGHVVLNDGGTLRNVDQLTAVSHFIPTFTLGTDASLKFRASNDGSEWGDYVSIKPYDDNISSNFFNLPNVRYVEFKADGGQVDISEIKFFYTCSESDVEDKLGYESGTSFEDTNLNNYTINNSFNDLIGGLSVYKKYSDGTYADLPSDKYEITLKDSSGNAVDKSSKLQEDTYTVVISRKDIAFADISYSFDVNGAFRLTTNLNEIKEIHTSQQKTYLSYAGDYATMPDSMYPDGSANISSPNNIDLAWDYTPIKGKQLSNYSVIYGQYNDLSDGYEMTGSTNKSISLTNVYLGTNYFKIVANYSDGTKESSAIKSFEVDGTAPRNLNVGDRMTNCRDMGGRSNGVGGVIKQGLLYRTCGSNYNMDGKSIDTNGKSILANQLGVKTEINLSDDASYDVKIGGDVTLYDCLMDYATSTNPSRHHFSRNAESVKNVFKILADEDNYPVFFHCRIGTDRTGLIANLVSGVLGVDLNLIYQDYLFSNFGKIGKKRYIGSKAGDDNIEEYMKEISQMPGENWQQKTYNMLLSLGLERSTIDSVINILTKGDKPVNTQGQISANAGEFAVSGTTVVHTSKTSPTERTNPEYSATLSNGASVSYTFSVDEDIDSKIYGYLGHSSYSDSYTISGSLKVEVDNKEISVPSTTFKTAGMGNCSNRVNYYPVYLGDAELSSGQHTIKITGKANSMSIGNLSIFKNPPVYPTGISLNESSITLNVNDTKQLGVNFVPEGTNAGKGIVYSSADDDIATVTSDGLVTGIAPGTVQITATSTYNPNLSATIDVTVQNGPLIIATFTTNDYTKKSDGAAFTNNNLGTYVKLTNNGDSIEFTFNSAFEGTAILSALAATKNDNVKDSTKLWFDSSNAKFQFTVNGKDVAITDNTTTVTGAGMIKDQKPTAGDGCNPVWVDFPQINIISGTNTIKLTRTAGYSLYFYEFKVIGENVKISL